MMPVRQDAPFRIGGKIVLKPPNLRTGGRNIDVGIQRVNPPVAQIVGIVGRCIAKVSKIPCRPGGIVFMVPRDRFRTTFVSSPGWPVTIVELSQWIPAVVILYLLGSFSSRATWPALTISDILELMDFGLSAVAA